MMDDGFWSAGRMRRLTRRAGVVGTVLAGMSLAGPAGAVDLKTVGAWTAFRAETSDGTVICGVSSPLSEARIFYLKWYNGDNYLTVQAFKETWQIPPKASGKVSLTFVGNTPWTANSAPADVESKIVEFRFPKAVVKAFVKEFTTANSGTLEFPGGVEPAWPLTLTGSSGALDAMAMCIDGVAGPAADTPFAFMRRPQPNFGPAQPQAAPVPVPARPSQPF